MLRATLELEQFSAEWPTKIPSWEGCPEGGVGHVVRIQPTPTPPRRGFRTLYSIPEKRSMCGRFTLAQAPEAVARAFGLETVPYFPPRYNIAPSQPVGVIVQGKNTSQPEFRLMGWGLIPAWAKDPAIGAKLINARSETVTEKPSFRAAFKYRRCLIPADGFYEWQKKQRGTKQPFYFSMAGNAV
ncbi:MAG: SOS response-associated peptidase, partial [Thermosynechococcaceae cyanobacterium]